MTQKAINLICEELKQSKNFSLIIDSHVDQLVLAVKYVLNDGVPCKRVLTFISSARHKAGRSQNEY